MSDERSGGAHLASLLRTNKGDARESDEDLAPLLRTDGDDERERVRETVVLTWRPH